MNKEQTTKYMSGIMESADGLHVNVASTRYLEAIAAGMLYLIQNSKENKKGKKVIKRTK